jgi:hypothetical protein
MIGALLLLAATVQDGPPVLDDKSYKGVLEFILPSAEDAAWERLGWRTELWSAAQEARALNRPVLLWAMNGHPCGLT